MIDRENLRQSKIRERDKALEALYSLHPRLKEIDKTMSSTILEIAKLSILEKHDQIVDLKERLELLKTQQEEFISSNNIDSNIYTPNWTCKLCEDKGYIEAGKLCECAIRERLEEKAKKGNILPNLRTKRFSNFDSSYYDDEQDILAKIDYLKQLAIDISQHKDSLSNVILRGEVGRGKTHLALACANEALDRGASVYYVASTELLEEIRERRYSNDEKISSKNVLTPYLEPDLLIIDDLGGESTTEFSLSQLTYLINERNMTGKPWIITMNYSISELDKRYDTRLTDRLLENTKNFLISGNESIRIIKRRANNK